MFYIIFFNYFYKMKLKEFLDNNPIINSAQLAAKMWPENKSARSKLTNKLNENIVGSGKQRITDLDDKAALEVLQKLSDEIERFRQSIV